MLECDRKSDKFVVEIKNEEIDISMISKICVLICAPNKDNKYTQQDIAQFDKVINALGLDKFRATYFRNSRAKFMNANGDSSEFAKTILHKDKSIFNVKKGFFLK